MVPGQRVILKNPQTNQRHGLWDPKIQHRIHKGSPVIPILSWINLIPQIDIYSFKIYSNTVFPSTPRLS